eukprot:gene7296-496_t
MATAKRSKTKSSLPEGFFDDIKKDAKVRQVPVVDKTEQEWQSFQQEITKTEEESTALIAEEAEKSTINRLLDEEDEQRKLLDRVDQLKRRKEQRLQGKSKEADNGVQLSKTSNSDSRIGKGTRDHTVDAKLEISRQIKQEEEEEMEKNDRQSHVSALIIIDEDIIFFIAKPVMSAQQSNGVLGNEMCLFLSENWEQRLVTHESRRIQSSENIFSL